MELTLQSPIMPHWRNGVVLLTQLFAQNNVPFYKELGMTGHNGLDFSTGGYTKYEGAIFAAHDGWVTSDATLQSDTGGRYVKLMSEEVEINGRKCKVESTYFHLSKAKVSITDDIKSVWFVYRPNTRWIKKGQLIGWSGNTGRYTTGAHLHFHIRPYWKEDENTYKMDYYNGYNGAIDPLPLFKDNQIYQYGGSFYMNGEKLT